MKQLYLKAAQLLEHIMSIQVWKFEMIIHGGPFASSTKLNVRFTGKDKAELSHNNINNLLFMLYFTDENSVMYRIIFTAHMLASLRWNHKINDVVRIQTETFYTCKDT